MSDEHPPRRPTADEPSKAGLYDAALAREQGGGDHFGTERETVRAFTAKWGPGLATNATANRAFLRRAVRAVADRGVRQFLDLGCAAPTATDNVHEIAQSYDPDARVVYVDNDPKVLAHWAAVTPGNPAIAYLEADIRDVDDVLNRPCAKRLIDWSEPLGLLAVTTPHYLPDADDPTGVLAAYMRGAVVGSHIAISHICRDGADEELIADLKGLYMGGMYARDTATILGMFQGWELLEPGELVDVRDWRDGGGERSPLPLLCGVAVKRAR